MQTIIQYFYNALFTLTEILRQDHSCSWSARMPKNLMKSWKGSLYSTISFPHPNSPFKSFKKVAITIISILKMLCLQINSISKKILVSKINKSLEPPIYM